MIRGVITFSSAPGAPLPRDQPHEKSSDPITKWTKRAVLASIAAAIEVKTAEVPDQWTHQG